MAGPLPLKAAPLFFVDGERLFSAGSPTSFSSSNPGAVISGYGGSGLTLAHGHSVQFIPPFMKKGIYTEVAVTKTAESAAPAQQSSQEAKRRPLRTFTLGDVSVSVWCREHTIRGEARTFYSLTDERSYRDAAGQYRYTRSLNPNDLGAVMSLCQQAGEFINQAQDLVPATAED